jgi:sialic acid synthase SpsE
MDVAALAMGANLVEKTITLDRTFRSAEHMFSLEPDEMRPFIDIIREVEDAMGSPRRIMHKDELKKRLAARRSIHVLTDLKSGHRLTESNLDYRRPGYGIPPDEYNRVIGAVLLHSKSAGDRLEWSDLA